MSNAGVAPRRHKPPLMRTDLSWQEHAQCVKAHDHEIFHDETRYDEALQYCAGCPVQLQCRRLGVGKGPGVWGGIIQRGDYATLYDRLPPTPDPRCGTVAGHSAHRRRGEHICAPCKEANNISSHARRPKK